MPRGIIRIDVTPPYKGMKTDLPRHLVEDGFFVDGENVLIRDSALVVRPGYTVLPGTAPFTGSYGLGGFTYRDNSHNRVIIGFSPLTIQEFSAGTWTDRTGGTGWGPSLLNQPRAALFQTNTESRVIITDNTDIPKSFQSGSDVTNLDSSAANPNPAPSRAKDVTVAFQRVIFGNIDLSGESAPSSLIVSESNDPDTYPPLNRVDLSDTNDSIVAVRALNAQQFAVYKDNSQWIAIGNPDRFPFTYELRSQATGPCSPDAVVVARGTHYYIGQDADIYSFDGANTRSIGANIRRALQSDVNLSKIAYTWGLFNPIYNEIWWFYISNDNSAALYPDSAITYNIETGAYSAIHRFADYFTGYLDYGYGNSLSWASLAPYTWTSVAVPYPTWASFHTSVQYYNLLMDSAGSVHYFGGDSVDDNGDGIDAYVVSPFRNYTGAGEINRVDAVESYWKQSDTSKNLDIVLLKTDTLSTDGDEVKRQTFNLRDDERHLAKYADSEARFIAVKQSVDDAESTDQHRGMTLYLYDRKAP